MGRKVTYHSMLCLWKHENALQRSQDPKQKQKMRGQTKAQVENRGGVTAATGVIYARSIVARVSQICA